MAYTVAYNPALGNALVGVTESTMPIIDGIVYVEFNGDVPDLPKVFWNNATLAWNDRILPILTKREFLKKFTADEYADIKAASASNSTVDYYWQQFILAEEIVMSDPDTMGGIRTLEAIGLLAPGRADEIIGV